MQTNYWKQGLVLTAEGLDAQTVKIATTRDAATFLVKRWKGARTACYYRAVLTCTRALRGEVADDYVESIFRVAAIEAKFSIEHFDPFWDAFESEISRAAMENMRSLQFDMPMHLAAGAEMQPHMH